MSEDIKKPHDEEAKKRQRERVEKLLGEAPIACDGSATIGGRSVGYAVRSQFIPVLPPSLAKDEGEPQAAVFTIAYLQKDPPAQRALCFVFNGGPGSSSVWLHLGAVGPKRVVMTDEGQPLPPPYRMVDNDSYWLAFTDL